MSWNGEAAFLEHLPQLERIIASVCRRHCLRGAEGEDFASVVKLHLIEGDYRVLRQFRGQAKLTTFLTTVVHNQFRDFRIKKWGRWRPSAAARRLGVVAVQLETLLMRDGLGESEAIQILQQNHQVQESEEELTDLAAQLPVRHQRYFTGDEVLERMPASEGEPDPVREEEKAATARKVYSALEEVFAQLDPEDLTLLRLRFQEGFMVSRIAPLLGVEQKPLYRRIYGLLGGLKRSLKERGVGWREAAEALDWQDGEMEFSLGEEKLEP